MAPACPVSQQNPQESMAKVTYHDRREESIDEYVNSSWDRDFLQVLDTVEESTIMSDVPEGPPEREESFMGKTGASDNRSNQTLETRLVHLRPESAGSTDVMFNILPANTQRIKPLPKQPARISIHSLCPRQSTTCESVPHRDPDDTEKLPLVTETQEFHMTESSLPPVEKVLQQKYPQVGANAIGQTDQSSSSASSSIPLQQDEIFDYQISSTTAMLPGDPRSSANNHSLVETISAIMPTVLEPASDPKSLYTSESPEARTAIVSDGSPNLRRVDLVHNKDKQRHAQAVQNDGYRITKTASNRKHTPEDRVTKAANADRGSPNTGPSEEDLLYFLMYQTRQRGQEHEKFVQQQLLLQEENKTLLEVQETLQRELQDTAFERDQLVSKTKQNRDLLDTFMNKYRKLKTWALAMNDEYAMVRQEGRALKTSLVDLRQQNSSMWKPVQETLASNSAAIETVDNVKASLTETSQSVATLNNNLRLTLEKFAITKTEVRALKGANQKYESYIGDLSVAQQQFNNRTLASQSKVMKALEAFNQKLESAQLRQGDATHLSEGLRLLQNLSGRDYATSAGFDALTTTVYTLSEQLQVCSKRLEDKAQSSSSCITSAVLIAELTPIIDAMNKLRPNIAEFESIQHENIRLQERANGDKLVRDLIEQAREVAENRQARVETNNVKLIDSLTQKREYQQKHLSKTVNELQTQLSTMTTKWTTLSSDLETNKKRLRLREQEMESLRQRLQENETQHLATEAELLSQHGREVELIEQKHEIERTESNNEFQQQLQQLRDYNATSMQALVNMQKEKGSAQEELDQLTRDKEDSDRRLCLAQVELSKQIGEANKQKQLYIDLDQKYNEVHKKMGVISVLEKELTNKGEMIDQLQAKVKEFNTVQAALAAAQASCTNKDIAISKLDAQVARSDQVLRKNAELEQQAATQRSEMATQKEQLVKAKESDTKIQELEKDARQNAIELHRCHDLLEAAQTECNRLQNSEKERAQHENDADRLRIELALAKEHDIHATDLEDRIHQQDVTIAEFERQVSNMGQLEDDLKNAKQYLFEKETQIDAQIQEIKELKGQTERQSQWYIQSQGNDLDELFTQNTNLSITTSLVPSNQNTSSHTAQVTVATKQVPVNSLQVVDPRVIMAATPSVLFANTSKVTELSSSQTSIIPDSQFDLATRLHDSHQKKPITASNNRSTSPLTEIDEDDFDSDVEIEDSCPKEVIERKFDLTTAEQDHLYDLLPSSPALCKSHKSASQRPTSALSQEEMLLQTSEIGRHSSERAARGLHGHPGTNTASTQFGPSQPRSAHTNVIKSDRRPFMKVSERQTSTDQDISLTSDAQNIRAVSRERALPNSAAKRRVDEAPTDIDERYNTKRPKIESIPPESRSSGRLRRASTFLPASRSANSLPAGSRSGGLSGGDVSTTTRNGKRSKPARKHSKHHRYAEKFGDGSQS